MLGPSLTNAMLAIGIVFIPQMARVVRSAVITVRERDYIEAERALGAGNAQIVFSGILPNSMAPLIVQSTLILATAILDVAALSFLGLGAQPPTPEWGAMLTDAFRSGFGVFLQGQHAIIFPGIAIALSRARRQLRRRRPARRPGSPPPHVGRRQWARSGPVALWHAGCIISVREQTLRILDPHGRAIAPGAPLPQEHFRSSLLS